MGRPAALRGSYASRLNSAREQASAIAESAEYHDFVELARFETPWRFNRGKGLDVFLRGVDHHLLHFIPKLLRSVDRDCKSIFEFGCGTGSAAIALLMVFPEAICHGVDIDGKDVSLARARAKVYGVEDRCRFERIDEGSALSVPDDEFDLCTCCSVFEYVTAPEIRRRCMQEMARIVMPGGLLFMTVPNRLYPIEIHTRKLGWNWFPKLLKATAVGTTALGAKSLARPYRVKIYNTPLLQFVTPWTNFCLQKQS